jgi:hypothetical protein
LNEGEKRDQPPDQGDLRDDGVEIENALKKTWVLTKSEENQLLVLKRKVFRTICGSKLENGVYRRRYNFEH